MARQTHERRWPQRAVAGLCVHSGRLGAPLPSSSGRQRVVRVHAFAPCRCFAPKVSVAAALNAVALNGDKAVQALRLVKGGKAS